LAGRRPQRRALARDAATTAIVVAAAGRDGRAMSRAGLALSMSGRVG
jgi:hypothetical protein